MKLNTTKFAFAAGILGAIAYFLITLFALINIPGFLLIAQLLEKGYAFYGYSISVSGLFIGAIYGFLEGFVWLGMFALIYNRLIK